MAPTTTTSAQAEQAASESQFLAGSTPTSPSTFQITPPALPHGKIGSLLDQLRTKSHVDIDSLDVSAARSLGPFRDCTSNQAIAFGELQLHQHARILKHAAQRAQRMHSRLPFSGVSLVDLAVEVATVTLALLMLPHLTGRIHVQANPFDAYSTSKTVACGERLVAIAREMDSTFLSNRMVIKVPSTWEGLMACKQLEGRGVRSLATTLFTLEQAVLAAEVRATYVAPYVNELRVHFEAGYRDPAPNVDIPVTIQRYYTKNSIPTLVLPASLTSVQEIMSLAGVQHITIAPPLLQALADAPPTDEYRSLFSSVSVPAEQQPAKKLSFIRDEAGFRMAVTRSGGGAQEKKLTEAINIFCDMQVKLKELMRPLLVEGTAKLA